MGTHHPLQLLLVAAGATAAAAEVVVVRNTGQKYYAAAAAAAEVVVVRNTGQKYYSLARSPLRLPGSADIYIYIYIYKLLATGHCLSLLVLFPGALPLASAGVGGFKGCRPCRRPRKNGQ